MARVVFTSHLLRHVSCPESFVNANIYGQGLAVGASGNRLAMSSTTGGLWLSEDQGDSWRCIGAHPPPIYAVRFA